MVLWIHSALTPPGLCLFFHLTASGILNYNWFLLTFLMLEVLINEENESVLPCCSVSDGSPLRNRGIISILRKQQQGSNGKPPEANILLIAHQLQICLNEELWHHPSAPKPTRVLRY